MQFFLYFPAKNLTCEATCFKRTNPRAPINVELKSSILQPTEIEQCQNYFAPPA